MTIMETDRGKGVLVSGSRGFVGRSLGKLLERHGFRVICADVAPADAGPNETVCDITDVSELRRLFLRQKIDAIVHLAAVLPTAAQREPQRATRVNIQGSLNLLEMAREFGVRRFVFGSSLSVYGTCPMDEVVSEENRAAPEDVYGAGKAYVEQLGEAYRQIYGMEFVSLRIGRVVGPGARSTTSAWRSGIFEKLSTGGTQIEIPYVESERILLVHVDDVARMLLQLLRAERHRYFVYNAACESVIVAELKRELERLNQIIHLMLGSQEVVGNPRRVDWSRFEDDFGFKIVPILERVARAAKSAS